LPVSAVTRWNPGFVDRVVQLAERHGLIRAQNGELSLTDDGRVRTKAAIVTTLVETGFAAVLTTRVRPRSVTKAVWDTRVGEKRR
jgi:hypothetical protein